MDRLWLRFMEGNPSWVGMVIKWRQRLRSLVSRPLSSGPSTRAQGMPEKSRVKVSAAAAGVKKFSRYLPNLRVVPKATWISERADLRSSKTWAVSSTGRAARAIFLASRDRYSGVGSTSLSRVKPKFIMTLATDPILMGPWGLTRTMERLSGLICFRVLFLWYPYLSYPSL